MSGVCVCSFKGGFVVGVAEPRDGERPSGGECPSPLFAWGGSITTLAEAGILFLDDFYQKGTLRRAQEVWGETMRTVSLLPLVMV